MGFFEPDYVSKKSKNAGKKVFNRAAGYGKKKLKRALRDRLNGNGRAGLRDSVKMPNSGIGGGVGGPGVESVGGTASGAGGVSAATGGVSSTAGVAASGGASAGSASAAAGVSAGGGGLLAAISAVLPAILIFLAITAAIYGIAMLFDFFNNVSSDEQELYDWVHANMSGDAWDEWFDDEAAIANLPWDVGAVRTAIECQYYTGDIDIMEYDLFDSAGGKHFVTYQMRELTGAYTTPWQMMLALVTAGNLDNKAAWQLYGFGENTSAQSVSGVFTYRVNESVIRYIAGEFGLTFSYVYDFGLYGLGDGDISLHKNRLQYGISGNSISYSDYESNRITNYAAQKWQINPDTGYEYIPCIYKILEDGTGIYVPVVLIEEAHTWLYDYKYDYEVVLDGEGRPVEYKVKSVIKQSHFGGEDGVLAKMEEQGVNEDLVDFFYFILELAPYSENIASEFEEAYNYYKLTGSEFSGVVSASGVASIKALDAVDIYDSAKIDSITDEANVKHNFSHIHGDVWDSSHYSSYQKNDGSVVDVLCVNDTKNVWTRKELVEFALKFEGHIYYQTDWHKVELPADDLLQLTQFSDGGLGSGILYNGAKLLKSIINLMTVQYDTTNTFYCKAPYGAYGQAYHLGYRFGVYGDGDYWGIGHNIYKLNSETGTYSGMDYDVMGYSVDMCFGMSDWAFIRYLLVNTLYADVLNPSFGAGELVYASEWTKWQEEYCSELWDKLCAGNGGSSSQYFDIQTTSLKWFYNADSFYQFALWSENRENPAVKILGYEDYDTSTGLIYGDIGLLVGEDGVVRDTGMYIGDIDGIPSFIHCSPATTRTSTGQARVSVSYLDSAAGGKVYSKGGNTEYNCFVRVYSGTLLDITKATPEYVEYSDTDVWLEYAKKKATRDEVLGDIGKAFELSYDPSSSWCSPLADISRYKCSYSFKLGTHHGYDVAYSGCGGKLLYPVADAKVVATDGNDPYFFGSADRSSDWGRYVILQIDGLSNCYVAYAHMFERYVNVGDTVRAASSGSSPTMLGRIGMTGKATGPHLHFAIFRVDGGYGLLRPLVAVNPENFFRRLWSENGN